jgi:hypothetical protein
VATVSEPIEEEGEAPTAAEPVAAQPRPLPLTMWATIGIVLAWFMVQLARFIGEPPDLDSMIGMRGSLVIFNMGFDALITNVGGEGIHPPLMDMLNTASFALLGKDPRSLQLLSIPLFILFAGGVERTLGPFLAGRLRVAAAVTVVICPALALTVFSVWREGLMMIIVAIALALALASRTGVGPRPLALGLLLGLLPLTKENGMVLVVPFAVDAFLTGDRELRARLTRVAYVLGIPVAAQLLWRLLLEIGGATPWQSWVFSEAADDGPYVVALRAMFGLEDSIYLHQNLANAFIVNWLWLPTLLAVVSLALMVRRPELRRPAALMVGLIAIYTWTTLTYPTFTEPRYATPVIMLTVLLVFMGLRQWPRRAQPAVVTVLALAFIAGAWAPTDPVSREIWGVTSVGGEKIYNTPEVSRGPDRMDINFAFLNASKRSNERLRRLFATDATLVVADCHAMKFGEKLATVGAHADAFDRALPGARPLRCVFPQDLPEGAADGPEKIALVRTPEEDASGQPLAVQGSAIIVIR